MVDQKVSYLIAGIAKDLGFNEGCETVYWKTHLEEYAKNHAYPFYHNADNTEYIIEAPTQTHLWRWFREKHEIDINIYRINNKSGYAASVWAKEETIAAIGVTAFGKKYTFEESLELAFDRAFKILTKRGNKNNSGRVKRITS